MKKRILVADDDEFILRMLAGCIEHLAPDCQVVTVKDGLTALDELLKQSFDLLVTDYNIPRMHGLGLARVSRWIAPNMPLVMMTGQDIAKLRARIPSLNLVEVITKPFTMLELRKVLQQVGVGQAVEHDPG